MPGAGVLSDLTLAATPAGFSRAALFLLLTIAVLGGFLLIVALVTALRRSARRAAKKAEKAAEPPVDPWTESAKRLQPRPQRK